MLFTLLKFYKDVLEKCQARNIEEREEEEEGKSGECEQYVIVSFVFNIRTCILTYIGIEEYRYSNIGKDISLHS